VDFPRVAHPSAKKISQGGSVKVSSVQVKAFLASFLSFLFFNSLRAATRLTGRRNDPPAAPSDFSFKAF